MEGLSGSQGSQNPAVTLFHRRSALAAELFPHRVEAEKKPRASKLPRTRLIPEQEEVITSTSLRKTFLGAIIAGLIGDKTGRWEALSSLLSQLLSELQIIHMVRVDLQ